MGVPGSSLLDAAQLGHVLASIRKLPDRDEWDVLLCHPLQYLSRGVALEHCCAVRTTIESIASFTLSASTANTVRVVTGSV